MKSRGFTLIELLVVISIISLLSTVVLASVQNTRIKARDAQRRSDMRQMANALELYYSTYNTYIVSGTGWSGCGCGWYNYSDGGNYAKSVSKGLSDAGLLSLSVRDPLLSSDNQTPQYMIYTCGTPTTGFFVFAKLENPTSADAAAYARAGTCADVNFLSTNYGMNYAAGHIN